MHLSVGERVEGEKERMEEREKGLNAEMERKEGKTAKQCLNTSATLMNGMNFQTGFQGICTI